MSRYRHLAVWYGIALAVIALDWLTKQAALAYLPYGQPQALLPVLDLYLVYNPGAAFSFLSQAGGWQRWFFSGVAALASVALVVWIARLPRSERWLPLALALVLGGALGNLHDRLVYGHVVDFISAHWFGRHYFPAFNAADSAISVGAVMILLQALFEKPAQPEEKPA